MKNPIPLLVILLLLWIIGGYWWYSKQNCCGTESCPMSLTDGDAAKFEAENNLSFAFAGSRPDMPAAARGGLEKMADYLANNTNRQLTLTGYYMEKELEKAQADVGLARATEVKKYLAYLGAPAQNIDIVSKLLPVIDFNSNNRTCNSLDYAFSEKEVLSGGALSISDGSLFAANADDNLKFAVSNNAYEPLSTGVEAAFRQTGAYLKTNPDKAIQVMGYYHGDETNNTAFPNLGLARANKIKDLLVSMGATADQIELAAEKVDKAGIALDNDLQIGMASYGFMAKQTDRLEEVRSRLQGNKLTLYFATGAQTLNLSEEERNYFADLVYYLDRVPNGKVAAEGHTDNVGKESVNTRLSRKRAEFVRDYLMKNGIRQQQTQVKFQGPNSPVTTNDTPEGRAKNRRVEVYLQK